MANLTKSQKFFSIGVKYCFDFKQKNNGYDRKAFAYDSKVSQGTVSGILNQKVGSSPKTQEKMADALGLDVPEIIRIGENLSNGLGARGNGISNPGQMENLNLLKDFNDTQWAIQTIKLLQTVEEISPNRMNLVRETIRAIVRGDNLQTYEQIVFTELSKDQKVDSVAHNKASTPKV